MAFTVTLEQDSVWGNKRVQIMKVVADAAEANLTTAFSQIHFASFQPIAGNTMPVAQLNANSSGTAGSGTLGVSGTSSGNSFRALVLGV